MDVIIRKEDGYGSGGLVGYMPEDMTVGDINAILGFRAQHRNLDKSKRTWVFTIDGVQGHIYDYKDSPVFHFGGSVAAFKLLAVHLGLELVDYCGRKQMVMGDY